uniref:Diphthine--ammonia ligase n=1 Tax=Ignisphaera aggregans TaxID=334771 RepID=A0A7C2VM79_9CREN
MKFCALLSGGKDSNYALYRALKEGHTLACVVIVKPIRDDSWLFHAVYPEIALLQAEAMGLEKEKVFLFEVSGEKETEVSELENYMVKLRKEIDFDTILCGAISSRYQLTRFEKIAGRLGVKVYSPLWGIDQEKYMKQLVEEGFVFVITKIMSMGLPPDFLAKPIDLIHVEKIINLSRLYGFNPAFEGGEAETLVVEAPHYRYSICIEGVRESLTEFEHVFKISKYWLGEKGRTCVAIL